MGYSALVLLDTTDDEGLFARVLAFLDGVGRSRAREAVAPVEGQASPPDPSDRRYDDLNFSNRRRRRVQRRKMREGPLAAVVEGRRDIWLVEDATAPNAAVEALHSRAGERKARFGVIVDPGGDVFMANLAAVACRLLAGPKPTLVGVGVAEGASSDALSRALTLAFDRWTAALVTSVVAGGSIAYLAPLPRGVCPVAARGLLLGYPVCYCTLPPPHGGAERPTSTLFQRARRVAMVAASPSGLEPHSDGLDPAADAVAQGSTSLCGRQLVVAAAGDGRCSFQFSVPVAAWEESAALRTQVCAWQLAARQRGWRVQRAVEAAQTVIL